MTARLGESRCSCPRCVAMCETRPCLPLPDEATRLDPARTMIVDFGSVSVTSPAIVGKEGQTVNGYATGRCTFLRDGLCELHTQGLKPAEGRIAHHSVPWRIPRSIVLERWAGQPVVIL